MPYVRTNFQEFFNERSTELQFRHSTVDLPWPHSTNRFNQYHLYAGDIQIGERDFLEVNGERDGLTIEISARAWNKYMPEVRRIATEYEQEAGVSVVIEKH